MIATNGIPTYAALSPIDELIVTDINIDLHADVDSAGIGICQRSAERASIPWCVTKNTIN